MNLAGLFKTGTLNYLHFVLGTKCMWVIQNLICFWPLVGSLKNPEISQSNNLTEYSPQPLIFQYLFLWNLTVSTKLVCKDKGVTKLDFYHELS